MTHESELTDRTTELLDRMRAEIERETGHSVSRQEFVARIVELSAEKRSETVELFRA